MPIHATLTASGYEVLPITAAPTLDAYSNANPMYIAHRGGRLMYPENTTEGFWASYLAGNRVMEMDVQALSDGALCVMHDGTVTATTTSTGNVVSFDTAGWLALAIDANTVNGSNFGNALVPPLFVRIVKEFNGKVIFMPEAKSAGSGDALTAALVAAGVRGDQALVNAFALSDLTAAVQAGYPTLYFPSSLSEIPAIRTAGVPWVGLDSTTVAADIRAWVAAGFKVAVYSVNKRWERDEFLAMGVTGIISDDPQYVSQRSPIAAKDNFVSQRWMPGMVSVDGTTTAAKRGQFTAPDLWGMPLDGANFTSVLQGWAGPIKGDPSANSFTVNYKVTFRAANGGDTTRWCSVFFNKNDENFADGVALTAAEQGFHFLMRKSGAIQIYKRSTSAATQVATTNTTLVADDEEVAFRIVVTPTTVTLYRLDGSGNVTHTVTYSDSDQAFRGGYMHLCRTGLGADFRSISIT